MTFQIGENVGPYQIVEQLGRGGMATVYKAYHPSLDRFVAIKGMHVAFSQDPNFLARFQREARVVAMLEHPNIVPVYDFSEQNGQPYLVMKFIEGDTLKAYLSNGPLDADKMIEIVRSIGSALEYAHKQGILHRDVKPSNVLMGNDGGIYLTDFGLARIAQAGESTLSADMMLGTPQYISPEQAIGSVELNEGTDIYSFGVMLYELTVGEVPFSADTPYSIVHDHIYTPLPLPWVKKADVPESIERVLLKALAKKREDRHESIGKLVDAFVHAVDDLSSPLPRPAAIKQAAKELAEDPAKVDLVETKAVANAGTPAPTQAFAVSDSGAGEKPKRKWRWWYAIPVVILLCLCGLMAAGAIRDAREGTPVAENPTTSPEELPPIDEPPGGEPGPDEPLPPGEEPGPQDFPDPDNPDELPPALPLEEAQAYVDRNPDDPIGWLELAGSLWNANMPEEAIAAFEQAYMLSEGNRPARIRIAEFLSVRGAYLEAVDVMMEIAAGNEGRISPEFRGLFEKALFNAALSPELADRPWVSEDSPLMQSDALIVEVTRIRYEAYHGDLDLAWEMSNGFFDTHDEYYAPAEIVYAELLWFDGDIAEAIRVLEEVIAQEPRLSWARGEAQDLIQLIKESE